MSRHNKNPASVPMEVGGKDLEYSRGTEMTLSIACALDRILQLINKVPSEREEQNGNDLATRRGSKSSTW